MTLETRSSALDPFLTMRTQINLLMEPPGPQLLIDGDNLTVTNALDRTDDPAVLITGSNNVFVNETGATLTGTGTDPSAPDAAIEITGVGNRVENQSGATIAGTGGVFSSAADTDVVNNGDIVAINSGSPFSGDQGFAVRLGADSSVVNTGFVSAQGVDNVLRAISMGDRAHVDNAGTVEATGEFAAAIEVGANSAVVNTGTASGMAVLDGSGIVAAGVGSTVHNFGLASGTSSAAQSNAFGIASLGRGGDTALVWNGGIVEANATGGGNAQGIVVEGGRLDNEGTLSATATVGSDLGNAIGAFLNRADGVNSGTITASTDAGTGAGIGVLLLFEGEFANSGDILATASTAVGFNGTDHAQLTNTGTITAVGADMPSSSPFGATAIDIGNSAVVQNDGLAEANGVSAIGINTGAEATIVNSGDIVASGLDASGVVLADGEFTNTGTVSAIGPQAKGFLVRGDAVIVNDGVISAVSEVEYAPSVGIWFETNEFIQKTIVNTGTIMAEVAIFDATAQGFPETDILTLENSGLIAGEVILGNAVDKVFNSGTINGDVDLGNGDDLFDGRGGQVNGTVSGGLGNDILIGGDGNDILTSDDGINIFVGGAGADVIDGGVGLDTLDYSESAAGVQVNLGDATLSTSAPIKAGAGTAFGGDAEGDTFQDIERVIGSSFDDFVYGGSGFGIVELGDGNDVFDNRSADSGNDEVYLGAGNDVARAGAGDDLVFGGAGRDRLFGENGNDVLLGQDGRDLLVGGHGNDWLDGGAGDDLLAGGAGNDSFIFGLDGGNDLIFGFQAGIGSDDVVDLTAFDTILSFDDVLAIATETGHGSHASTVLTFDMDTTLTFTSVRLADLNEADFILV